MPTITIAPATAGRFDDAEHALTGGDGPSCQCQWWRMRNTDFQRTTREDREGMLRAELDARPAPALVAYVDDEAAGWVRVGPRTTQPRLSRTRTFAASSHDWDDPTVWAVTCFVVRRDYRGLGLMTRLLAAAVDHARENGARVIEAYPIDTTVSSRASNELYTGILSVFEAAGFREVTRPKPERVIVELRLGGAGQ